MRTKPVTREEKVGPLSASYFSRPNLIQLIFFFETKLVCINCLASPYRLDFEMLLLNRKFRCTEMCINVIERERKIK